MKEQKKQLDERTEVLKKIQIKREEQQKQYLQNQLSLKRQLAQQQQSYNLLITELKQIKEENLPEKRPSFAEDLGVESERRKLTQQSQGQQQDIRDQKKHQKTNSNSTEKYRDSGAKSHPPKNRQHSGEKSNNDTIKQSERSQTQQEIAKITQAQEQQRQKRRVAESSRRDIVRKLRGATNYYSGARRE